MKLLTTGMALAAWTMLLTACGNTGAQEVESTGSGSHTHADGTVHESTQASDDHGQEAGGHAHDETSLGSVMIGEMTVELAQGHGAVAAGEEGHLVVKLPYSDNGLTVVRAWIGTADRTLSFVGKGEYAKTHDDYDIHAVAPTPLPAGALWWIEIEKPDGTRLVGSARPITN